MDGTRYTSVFSCGSKIVCFAAPSLPNLLPEDFYPLKRRPFLTKFVDVFLALPIDLPKAFRISSTTSMHQ